MRGKWIAVLCIGFFLTIANYSTAQQAKEITCSGNVVNVAGEPIAGAQVGLYKMKITVETMSYDVDKVQETTTKEDGTFSIKVQTDNNELTGQTIILVQKEGYAIGWANWRLSEDADVKITLDIASVLSGVVVDEASKPVADAEVSISFMVVRTQEQPQYLVGRTLPGILTVKTDEEGKFSFDSIPGNATAEFVVKKTGKATISTLDIENTRGDQLQFTAGQTNIEIIMPEEAKIEGMTVEKSSSKPVAGIKMMAVKGSRPQPFSQEIYVSKEDGTFNIDSLEAGVYSIQLVPSSERMDDWIAEPVEVTTEAGKTTSGIKVELNKGGILEVEVTEADSNEPIEKARVIIQRPGGGISIGSTSDANGIAGIRLNPGQYRIVQVYKEGYSRDRSQETVSVEDGMTAHIKCQLRGQPKITGVVRDEAGNPVEGVKLRVCPMGRDGAASDAEGKYEVSWDMGGWPSSGEIPEMYLVARCEERNLAAAVEIGEDTKTKNIQLKPGVTLVGKVVDPNNQGIPDARLAIMLRASSWGSTLGNNIAKIDAEGNFEVKAVPAGHKYSIEAGADGYGVKRIDVDTENAINNRLETETLLLPIANLSVSGIVVDVNDKPVANARIYCYGNNQPNQNTQSDAEGKFILNKICEGRISVSADKSGQTRLYGSVQTEGGATDIKIIIGERQSSTRYEPKRPPSLVRKALPELKDLGIEPLPDTTGKIMLVCFFDYQQRPSRNCIIQLSKKARKLEGKNIVVVAVQSSEIDKSTLDEWIKQCNISLPVGIIQDDEEKARFAWGIRSLPWLILTDKSHVVASNGFPLSQLESKIEALEK